MDSFIKNLKEKFSKILKKDKNEKEAQGKDTEKDNLNKNKETKKKPRLIILVIVSLAIILLLIDPSEEIPPQIQELNQSNTPILKKEDPSPLKEKQNNNKTTSDNSNNQNINKIIKNVGDINKELPPLKNSEKIAKVKQENKKQEKTKEEPKKVNSESKDIDESEFLDILSSKDDIDNIDDEIIQMTKEEDELLNEITIFNPDSEESSSEENVPEIISEKKFSKEVSKELNDLLKAASKENAFTEKKQNSRKKIIRPNFNISGRGLVYNCHKKHWACTDRQNYFICQNYNLISIKEDNKNVCLIDQVYASSDDCYEAQKIKIHQSKNNEKCN